MLGEVRAGRREEASDRGARSVQGRARLQIGSRARGGAHEEHGAHVRDAGGVEAQRLVERRRALPRVERRAYGAGRGTGRVAGGGGRPRCKQRAGEGSAADWGQGTRGVVRVLLLPARARVSRVEGGLAPAVVGVLEQVDLTAARPDVTLRVRPKGGPGAALVRHLRVPHHCQEVVMVLRWYVVAVLLTAPTRTTACEP